MQKIRNTKKLKKNIKKSFRKTKINNFSKINKMKGGLPKKLKQPLDDIDYKDRIPMYLPNFSEISDNIGLSEEYKLWAR